MKIELHSGVVDKLKEMFEEAVAVEKKPTEEKPVE